MGWVSLTLLPPPGLLFTAVLHTTKEDFHLVFDLRKNMYGNAVIRSPARSASGKNVTWAVAGTCRLYRMLLLCVPPVIATVPYMCGTGTLIVAGLQSFLTDPIVN